MQLLYEMAGGHQKGAQSSPSLRNATFFVFVHSPGASPDSVGKQKGLVDKKQ
jgi:hypothetical protein